jgi:sec-independent protein translocase protein TatB
VFGIGDQELFLIILFAFLLFGPDKLPGMGRTIGRALRQFKNAQEGVTKVVQTEIIDPIQDVANTDKGKAAAKAQAEDADLTEEEVAAAKPAETFAERRARLAAEKAAAEKGETPEATEADADSDSDADSDATAEPEAAPEPEPKPTTAAALYGLDDDDEDDLDDEEDA